MISCNAKLNTLSDCCHEPGQEIENSNFKLKSMIYKTDLFDKRFLHELELVLNNSLE